MKTKKQQIKRKMELIETESGEYKTIICGIEEPIDYDDLEDAVGIWKKGVFDK